MDLIKDKEKAVKIAAGAAAAGGLLFFLHKFKKRLTPPPAVVSSRTSNHDILRAKKEIEGKLEECRQNTLNQTEDVTARQMTAYMYSCELNSLRMLEKVDADITVERPGAKTTASYVLEFLLGPVFSFLLSLAALCFLINAKWTLEAEVSGAAASLLNIVIVFAVIAMVHPVIRVLYDLYQTSPKRAPEIEVTARLTLPEEAGQEFVDAESGRIGKNTEHVTRLLSGPATAENPALYSLAQSYAHMYQMKVLEDPSDLTGYVMPQCAKTLRTQGIEIITEYSPETASLFQVVRSEGYGKSFVVKPALRVKSTGALLQPGEYLDGR